MDLKVIKLGTLTTDRATALEGTVTHWICNMEKRIDYLFQPRGLDKEGQPVKKIHLEAARLNVKESDYEKVEIPFEVLGSVVANNASGFSGMAVEFVKHLSGCLHVIIQPSGTLSNSACPIRACEFDLRECTGDMIPKLTEQERKVTEVQNPSPTGNTEETTYPQIPDL
jgi:hypothetical protein